MALVVATLPYRSEQIKEALYKRHPGLEQFGNAGAWTCVEEWAQIDFLAFAAWTKPPPAQVRHARIGYEVKVTRGDMRAELLRPGKRARTVDLCHEFYFAIPKGLLKEHELAFVEPDWQLGDFSRGNCPAHCRRPPRDAPAEFRGTGTYEVASYNVRHRFPEYAWRPCEACNGVGYLAKSRVEEEAPTLWIPRDVGLVEVGSDGIARTTRKAPVREPRALADGMLNDLARWISVRPDPRHEQIRRERQAA